MRRLSAIILLCVLFATWASAADRPPSPRFTDPARRAKLEAAFPKITALFEQFWRERRVPGLVFGVVIDGELALVKGFGEQDRDTHAPATPDTVFRIASMTKSFTALAILQLRDAGKLSLEDPVSKWIPEAAVFDYPTRDTAPIRIRTLLTHGAGFPEDNPWGDRQLATPDDTLTQWLKKGLPFSTAPDTSYEYSNYGFALLGRIVARCSRVPYPEYIRKHILDPLGMRASTLDPNAVPVALRAIGYGDHYAVIPALPYGAFSPMGGMLVSARDLGRYVAFHLSAWPPRDDPETGPVRRSSVREMQHPWRPSGFRADTPATARASAYGYGLGVSQTCYFRRIVAHSGGLPGFGSNMSWLPDYGVGIFVMANLTYTAAGPVVEKAFEALRKTGALQPRELPPSPVLLSTREAIVRVWNGRSQQELEAMAADNLFQDSPAVDRMTDIARLRDEAGACGSAGPLKPENLLRGGFRIPCEGGSVDVYFTLAPTMPPKVQRLDFGIVHNLAQSARKSLEALAASHQEYGTCRFGETLGWGGPTHASVRLDCDRGQLAAQVDLESDGSLKTAVFPKSDDGRCAP